MTNRQATWEDLASADAAPRLRPRSTRVALVLCAILLVSGLFALGTWQLYRLQWKEALIARVAQRVHALAVEAPTPAQWPHITAEADEYRHVSVTGVFLHDRATRVQASTVLGSGYWLLTPMRRTDGSIVLVNRGFIPADRSVLDASTGEDSRQSTVTGLLRISEPRGGYLRDNDPVGNRWYSRDVQAIAAAGGLAGVAPYFVDADATDAGPSSRRPVGGLTVVSFHNNHMVYALTWYALALMVAVAGFWIVRDESRAALHPAVGPEGSNRNSADDKPHEQH